MEKIEEKFLKRIEKFRNQLKIGYYSCKENGIRIPESELSNEDALLHMLGLECFNHFDSRCGHYIETDAKELFANREYMLNAIRLYPHLIKYVDSSIADKEFLLSATEHNSDVLVYLHETHSFKDIAKSYFNKTDMEFYNNLTRIYKESSVRKIQEKSKMMQNIQKKFIEDSRKDNTDVVLFVPTSESGWPKVAVVRHNEDGSDEIIEDFSLDSYKNYGAEMPEIDLCCNFDACDEWQRDELTIGLIKNGTRPLNIEERLLLKDEEDKSIDFEYDILNERLQSRPNFKGGAEEEIDAYLSHVDGISEIKNSIGGITLEEYHRIVGETRNNIENDRRTKTRE